MTGSIRKLIPEQGGVAMEFTVVLPLLVTLFAGLLFAGKSLSQVSWIMQSCYQTALIGAESPPALGQQRMAQRLEQFMELLGRDLKEPEFTKEYFSQNDQNFVRVSVTSDLIDLGPLRASVSLEAIGPNVADVISMAGLNNFANMDSCPSGQWPNECGHCVFSYSGPCNYSPPPSKEVMTDEPACARSGCQDVREKIRDDTSVVVAPGGRG